MPSTKSVSPRRGINRRLRRQFARGLTPAQQREWFCSDEVKVALGADTCRERILELNRQADRAAAVCCSAAWADAWWDRSPTPWPEEDRQALWRGRWRVGAVYGVDDRVMFQGRRWQAISLNRASAPTAANRDWRMVANKGEVGRGGERVRVSSLSPNLPLSPAPAHAVTMALSLAETRNGLGPGHRRWTPPQCVESEDALDLMDWIEAAMYSHPPSPSATAIWKIVTQGREERR